ncbi:MAG: energy transducer TonB [Acidobacteriota bacterium]
MRQRRKGPRILKPVFLSVLVMAQPVMGQTDEGPSSRHFLYLSDKRIITAELASSEKVILNYINLDDTFELIEAPNLLVIDSGGRSYRGHLIRNEEPGASGEIYRATDLLDPKQYRGYDILGNFKLETPPREVYLRLGSRLVELEPISGEDFDLVAIKIGEIDLDSDSPKAALVDAGFWRGYGKLYEPGSEKAKEMQRRLPDLDPIPPVLLSNPAPRLPTKWVQLPAPVVVKVGARVTALGGVLDLKVIDGVNSEVDDLALQTVQNSWKFLPAISRGKTVDVELVVNVVFKPS